jgi:hypothetical protein
MYIFMQAYKSQKSIAPFFRHDFENFVHYPSKNMEKRIPIWEDKKSLE